MDILTLYVGQGALAVVRHGNEAIIVDSLIPDIGDGGIERMGALLGRIVKSRKVPGLVLTGFDADHCCPEGVELILSKFQPDWIMYPKYYKDTDCATSVFKIIDKHVKNRVSTERPLRRVSVRLDRLDSRILTDLSSYFVFELFSPHIEDADNSNNSSIVLKLTGIGTSGFSCLITGDTENDRWDRINSLFGSVLKSDVLFAPHHGSKNATNATTILYVMPNTVLISAGVDNQYGHPDPQAVRAYSMVAKVYATNVDGGATLFTKRNGTDFETQLFLHNQELAPS